MTKQNFIQTLPICSRCLINEINNWIADKRAEINPETGQLICQELKSVKLKPGKCIVCNHNSVADRVCENIVKIFEKTKADKSITKEFNRFFCMNA